MLVRARIWINENFEAGSRPKVQTVKGWIENGKIEGKLINGVAYVARYQVIENTTESTKNRKNTCTPTPTHPVLTALLN